MKHLLWPFIITLFFFSCSTDGVKKIENLEGYWEIEKVVFPDGNSKEYTFSQSIDFFMLENDSIGYRKKLQPKLDGTFLASDDAEKYILKTSQEETTLHYKNDLSEWTETVVKLNEKQLILINQDNLKYIYKRFEKINIEE